MRYRTTADKDVEYDRMFIKGQKVWGIMRGEHGEIDLNSPRLML